MKFPPGELHVILYNFDLCSMGLYKVKILLCFYMSLVCLCVYMGKLYLCVYTGRVVFVCVCIWGELCLCVYMGESCICVYM